jgi:hypothetical protein
MLWKNKIKIKKKKREEKKNDRDRFIYRTHIYYIDDLGMCLIMAYITIVMATQYMALKRKRKKK